MRSGSGSYANSLACSSARLLRFVSSACSRVVACSIISDTVDQSIYFFGKLQMYTYKVYLCSSVLESSTISISKPTDFSPLVRGNTKVERLLIGPHHSAVTIALTTQHTTHTRPHLNYHALPIEPYNQGFHISHECNVEFDTLSSGKKA